MPTEVENYLDLGIAELGKGCEPHACLLRTGHPEKRKPRDSAKKAAQTEEYLYVEEENDNENFEPEEPEELPPQETYVPEYLNPNETIQSGNSKSSFTDGTAVGIGIGLILSSAILWIGLFLAPLLPQSATYENLLTTYVYLLVSLIGFGLVTLTAGVVREYYSKNRR